MSECLQSVRIMTFKRLSFGQDGEKRAVKFLKKNKYRILETNFTTKAGEIDIVAEQGGYWYLLKSKAGLTMNMVILWMQLLQPSRGN